MYPMFEKERGVGGGITFRCKVLRLNFLCDALCDGELVL
jgi:hypothetical protein